MNILLVQAYLGRAEPPVFPLGLSQLAAYVKGHNLESFDPNVSKSPRAEFKSILSKFKPDLIGISIRNIDSTNKRKVVFYYRYFKEMIDMIKDGPARHSKIIVGGSGFSMFARKIMHEEPRIDFGVYLEGEKTFPDLIDNLEAPQNVKGIFYRNNGQVFFTGLREHTNLNGAPPADRGIISMGLYVDVPDAIGVETKRGCSLSCIYCVYGFLNGKRYRLIDPKRIVDEIEGLVSRWGITRFMFVDSVFNIPLSHAEVICNEIIKRSVEVSWSAWFNEKYMTEGFVGLVKEAGCDKIMLSPDGFSDKVLLRLGKVFNKRDILNTFDILKKMDGLEVCFNFFKNPPEQDLRTFLSLLLFYLKAKFELRNRVHFEFNSMRIEPHTKLREIALEEGFISKEDSLLYPKYYTNTRTSYIDKIFNLILRLKGL